MSRLGEQIRWLAGHWQPYRRLIPILLVLTLGNAAVLVAYPYLLKRIIDSVTAATSAHVPIVSIVLLLLVGVVRFCFYVVLQTIRTRLNMQFEFGVRLRAFEYLQAMGAGFFRKFRTGDLVTRLMDDVSDKLSWYICSGIFRVVEAASIILFGLAMMISISPELTLYAAGPLPILVALFVTTAHRLHQRYEIVQASISKLNDSLETCFSGIRVVKAFAAEDQQQLRVNEAIDKQRQAEIRAVRWQTVIDSLYGNIWQLAVVGVLLAGGTMAIAGRITLGDIVAFEAYVLLLVWPMFDIGQFLVRGRLSAVSIDRLCELEEFPPEIAEPQLPVPETRTPEMPDVADPHLPIQEQRCPTIRLHNVSYRYPGSSVNALAEVNFEAKAGELTAIAGAIGAGKSTLLELVPRLIDPVEGTVFIDNEPLEAVDLVQHRLRLGYVSQEPVLLSGTIEENIRFGRIWVTPEQLEQAILVAQLSADLAEMPDGLATVVGSRGVRLSGGQKQRVAVARALACSPGILLLDDCTASLDANTERALWEQLPKFYPHCTTLVVTHRPSTLQRAHSIVLLERGRVVERGTFAQLHRPGTQFHEMYVRWEMAEQF